MRYTNLDLQLRFQHLPPSRETADKLVKIRDVLLSAASDLNELIPECAEKDRALDRLEEVKMLASFAVSVQAAGIARPSVCQVSDATIQLLGATAHLNEKTDRILGDQKT